MSNDQVPTAQVLYNLAWQGSCWKYTWRMCLFEQVMRHKRTCRSDKVPQGVSSEQGEGREPLPTHVRTCTSASPSPAIQGVVLKMCIARARRWACQEIRGGVEVKLCSNVSCHSTSMPRYVYLNRRSMVIPISSFQVGLPMPAAGVRWGNGD